MNDVMQLMCKHRITVARRESDIYYLKKPSVSFSKYGKVLPLL